jgi:hypothetical protein
MSPRTALLACLLAGCGAPDTTFTCQSTTTCGELGSIATCCTDAHCEYRVSNGTTFACAGIECSSAHAALVLYCAPHCSDPDASAQSSDAGLDGAVPSLDAQPCVR